MMSLAMLYPRKTQFLHRKRPTIATLCSPTHSTISLPHAPLFQLQFAHFCTKSYETTSVRFLSVRTTLRHHQPHVIAKIDLYLVVGIMYYFGSVSTFLFRFFHF